MRRRTKAFTILGLTAAAIAVAAVLRRPKPAQDSPIIIQCIKAPCELEPS